VALRERDEHRVVDQQVQVDPLELDLLRVVDHQGEVEVTSAEQVEALVGEPFL
jgi:hypothetical protein